MGGSKITADGNFSHEIKRHLLLERKTMTNLDCILKSRDIILPTKVHLAKAMVFPVYFSIQFNKDLFRDSLRELIAQKTIGHDTLSLRG